MKRSKNRLVDLTKRSALGAFAVISFGILPACSGTPAATPAPSAAPAADAVYKAGSYTSEQDSGFAAVTITTEFSETAITSVSYEVTESRASDYFPDFEDKLKALCKTMVAEQTAEVDVVSGATLCSQALKKGVNDAIAQASLNPVESTVYATQTAMDDDFYAQVSDWLYSKDVTSASSARAFLPGEENTPTEEDICKILETANNYQWCHLLTAPHFIVIRDPEEQQALLPEMGVTGDGTVTILVLADGVKDQEFHAEAYDGRDAEGQHYWQMYYCIYEAGEAASMLNLAARSLGYRTRNYGAIHLYNQGVKDEFPEGDGVSIWYAGGNFDYIGGENWDISKYSAPKNGGEPFQHWFGGGYVDGEMTGKYVDVDGNLTLLCAIVVGKVDETDTISSATTSNEILNKKQYNYDFWD